MARINIEDSLFKDNRFFELLQKLGSTDAALGALVRAWIVAQEYWVANRAGIPSPIWAKQKLRPELIEVGFAEVRGEFVYVAGSEEQFAWLVQKVESGRKGGVKSGENRKIDTNKLIGGAELSPPRNDCDFSEAVLKRREAARTLLSPSPSPSLNLKNKNIGAIAPIENPSVPVPKKSKFSDETKIKMRAFMATYASAYREKYNAPPEGVRDKALVGKLGHWIESVSEDRACQLAQVYLQIDHRWINDSCHDLWQFFRHLNRIGNALATGQDPGGIDWKKVFGAA